MKNHKKASLKILGAALLAMGASSLAQASLIVDRGLPDENLNNAAGGDRSNVAWAFNDGFLSGNDFTLGALNPNAGKWRIDQIRVWTIGGESALGDRFSLLKLFMGADGSTVPEAASANLTPESNSTDNTNVEVNKVSYADETVYQGSGGGLLNIWQLDFFNLGLFDPGLHLFALGGEGADSPFTFMHASNAALSGTTQDGSDDRYRWFGGTASDASITTGNLLDSDGSGWDKSSDINIQVFATQVPAPSVIALMAVGLLGLRHQVRRRSAIS